jgi:hypothetical protein
MTRRILRLGLVLHCAIASCATAPHVTDTGARQAVQTFFEAVVQRDWMAAYASLHPDSKKRYSLDQFTRAAQNHRKAVGFEPEEVHIRSCEEHDTEATAHVVLTGHAGGKVHSYKDAVVAKRGDAGWGVVLPHSFGSSEAVK